MERIWAQITPLSPIQWLSALIGLALLLTTLSQFTDFPDFGPTLIISAILYLLLLFYQPRYWLIILPIVTVCLDLTTFTGRFIFNEFDLFFLTTIAYALITRKLYFYSASPKLPLVLITLYSVLLLLNFEGWSSLFSLAGPTYSNPYFLPDYSYKITKGFIWGLLLFFFWGHLYLEDKKQTVNYLILGAGLASIILGVLISWERGSLATLINGSPWYGIVSSFLDFSSSYRTTGIFSDMHTGGEVIDGIILLLLPLTLYGMTSQFTATVRSVAFLGFTALAYCTLVGITRATYVSFFITLALFIILIRYQTVNVSKDKLSTLLEAIVIVLITLIAIFTTKYAGNYYGVAAYSSIIVVGFIAAILVRYSLAIAIILATILTAVITLFALDAHFSSRWVEPSKEAAIFLSVGLPLLLGISTGLFYSHRLKSMSNQLIMLSLIILIPATIAFATGGYKINERMGSVSKDLNTRMQHWQNVLTSSDNTLSTTLFGNGVGTFPKNYLLTFPETIENIGSFSFGFRDGISFLTLGGGRDLAFGQRVDISAKTDYQLNLTYRTEKTGRLSIFFCERNLIFASNFMANCSAKSIQLPATSNQFQSTSFTINSGKVGAKNIISRWPTLIYLKNMNIGSIIDINKLELSANTTQLLSNNSFDKGMDHWFFYNDFSHLPWHIKNTFVQAYYDTGIIGFVLFLFMLLTALFMMIKYRNEHSIHPMFVLSVLAVCIFGMFGTPLDSSRVSWMFYLFLFAALTQHHLITDPQNKS